MGEILIKNFWNCVKLYCGNNHEKETEMQLIQGGASLFYACPCYYNLTKKCRNRINLIDFEEMLNTLMEKIVENEKKNIEEDMTGFRWKSKKGIEFEIMEHDMIYNKFKVKMLNSKAINTFN